MSDLDGKSGQTQIVAGAVNDQANLTGVAVGARAYRLIPWIVAIASFMQMLDTSILNTALPTIAVSLQQNPLNMHWAVVAFMLTMVVLLPLSGWLADRYGTRNVLFCAIALFSLGSLFCSLAVTLNQLILARMVQGAGGAFMFPVGRLVVLKVYPRHNLVRVMSMVSMPGLIGPLLGPTMGGLIVQYATWHWIFLINLPIGAVGMFAVWKLFPNLRQNQLSRLDFSGYLLCALAMVLISLSLDGGGHISPPLMAGGLLSVFLYWLHARRASAPLFKLSLFNNRAFSLGVAGNLFASLSSRGMPYLTPILLQVGLGYSPSVTGLLLLPMSVMAIAGKAVVTWLLGRFGYRPVLIANTLVLGLCIGTYSFFTPDTPVWVILICFSLFGAANSIQFTAMNTLALIDLKDDQTSSGNSLVTLFTQISISLGVSVAASLLAIFAKGGQGAAISQSAPNPELIGAFQMTHLSLALLCMVLALIFLPTPRGLGKNAMKK